MKTCELISIVCSALVAGMFCGPWAALSRSMRTFAPEVFLAIVDRMNRNMAPVMTVLMPATGLAMIPVLIRSYGIYPRVFSLYAAAFILFVVAMVVTVLVEVPIVQDGDLDGRHSTRQLAAGEGSLGQVSCDSRRCGAREPAPAVDCGDLLIRVN